VVVELMVWWWWRRGVLVLVLVVVVDVVEDVVVQRRLRVWWMRIRQWWVLVRLLLLLVLVLELVLLWLRQSNWEWGNRLGLGCPGRWMPVATRLPKLTSGLLRCLLLVVLMGGSDYRRQVDSRELRRGMV
jgi:hypothetical protein